MVKQSVYKKQVVYFRVNLIEQLWNNAFYLFLLFGNLDYICYRILKCNFTIMNEGKTQTLLFSISLILGIILTARTLMATKKEEEELASRISRLEERVDDLEE